MDSPNIWSVPEHNFTLQGAQSCNQIFYMHLDFVKSYLTAQLNMNPKSVERFTKTVQKMSKRKYYQEVSAAFQGLEKMG